MNAPQGPGATTGGPRAGDVAPPGVLAYFAHTAAAKNAQQELEASGLQTSVQDGIQPRPVDSDNLTRPVAVRTGLEDSTGDWPMAPQGHPSTVLAVALRLEHSAADRKRAEEIIHRHGGATSADAANA